VANPWIDENQMKEHLAQNKNVSRITGTSGLPDWCGNGDN
jgi:hypothetical protein